MAKTFNLLIERNAGTLMSDAIGAASLVIMLVIGLSCLS